MRSDDAAPMAPDGRTARDCPRLEQYEDRIRLRRNQHKATFISPYQDFRTYASSIAPEIRLGVNVIKPAKPGFILVQLHGWHMSMPEPQRRELPLKGNRYLILQVDMRGRAFSTGQPDCNGDELVDIYDAVQWAREEYAGHIANPSVVYLEGGSGGGGNVLAAVGKFPDLFAAATAYYGISDYALWYEQDATGEFRDEMDVWIGCPPSEDKERYLSRSGRALASNVLTPIYIAHGDRDVRVPIRHTELYLEALELCGKRGLVHCDVLSGVGGHGHLDGIADEDLLEMERQSERNRLEHSRSVSLPLKGRLVVGGYIYTTYFQIRLGSIDQLAIVDYDLSKARFTLIAAMPYRYTIRLADGKVMEDICCTDERFSILWRL